VRQLRQPARPRGADQPALAHRRQHPEFRPTKAPLPRPAAVRRAPCAAGSAPTRTGARTWRNFSALPARRDPAAADHPRPSTGASAIPVPGYAEDEHKRIYVWFDAVIGYLSASIEWACSTGDPEAWREWWQSPAAEHHYFQGKDNIVFHTVIWPAMLLGYGQGGSCGAGRGELELPTKRRRLRFLTMEGKQFSTSRGLLESSCATSSTATSPTRSATTSSPPGPRRRTRLHLATSCGARTTSYSELGQPRQPHR